MIRKLSHFSKLIFLSTSFDVVTTSLVQAMHHLDFVLKGHLLGHLTKN